jgi:hypothetical protein
MDRNSVASQYPGHSVFQHDDNAIDVYGKAGEYVAAFRRSGAGVWKDYSLEAGCDLKLKHAADKAQADKVSAEKK